jgi:hypothetical protein
VAKTKANLRVTGVGASGARGVTAHAGELRARVDGQRREQADGLCGGVVEVAHACRASAYPVHAARRS